MRNFIQIVEGYKVPNLLFHGTTNLKLKSIQSDGFMDNGSHWTPRLDIATWFAKHKAADYGGKPVIISLSFTDFDQGDFLPDENIMDFDIPAHSADFQQRLDKLRNPRHPTWKESLKYFDSVIYNYFIKADQLQVIESK